MARFDVHRVAGGRGFLLDVQADHLSDLPSRVVVPLLPPSVALPAIRDLNPVLRGWGNYFRTGNAARKFLQVDTYVWSRLRGFLVKRKGRHLRPGEASAWNRDFFHGHGLHRLRGTVSYPGAA